MKRVRCAIYTRKSSDDGLEQEFNSLDAQREACAAYIRSQKAEGWVLSEARYDDGGLSGGSLERPALTRLLADIGAGQVDQIVVYKIDRLTRSLSDFARIVDTLDAAGASFVSITQSFNTATSMGRLTLNMLLSFAQFEREVTAERIRDKIAASKKKGLWMGGNVPLGYDADGRTLKINAAEAETVRTLYGLYQRYWTLRQVMEEAHRLNLRTKRRTAPDGRVSGGQPFDRGHIYQILTNPIYAGRIRHKGQVYPGQHDPIISPKAWDDLQIRMQEGTVRRREYKARGAARKTAPSLLVGKVFDETGDRLTPSHTKSKTGTRLRYYISHRLVANAGPAARGAWRLPAAELEARVAEVIRSHLMQAGTILSLVPEAQVAEIAALQERLRSWLAKDMPDRTLMLAKRIELAPGHIAINLEAAELATMLEVTAERIQPDLPVIEAPFQLRKRGVETKIILSDAARTPDPVLLSNIANAHVWYEQIKSGKSYADIAQATGTSKRRVQQVMELAFLAPDIVRDVLAGEQPLGFTSDWCLRHTIPSGWDDQRCLLATL